MPCGPNWGDVDPPDIDRDDFLSYKDWKPDEDYTDPNVQQIGEEDVWAPGLFRKRVVLYGVNEKEAFIAGQTARELEPGCVPIVIYEDPGEKIIHVPIDDITIVVWAGDFIPGDFLSYKGRNVYVVAIVPGEFEPMPENCVPVVWEDSDEIFLVDHGLLEPPIDE